MKISFKHQAIKKANSAACSVTEYVLDHEMLDAQSQQYLVVILMSVG